MARRRLIVSAVVMLCGACGAPRTNTVEHFSRGLIWMIPGIEGRASMLTEARRGLEDGGVQSAIEVYDWQRRELFGLLANLVDRQQNLHHAAEIASAITTYAREHAGGPIDVVGYSGGGGLAVMVAEALPKDVHLRNLILVQAAISPEHDLSAALARIDGKLINFYSAFDWVILGLGTRAFGTMDRANVASAGNVGFNLEVAVPSAVLRRRVEQPEWTVAMMASGHYGGHFGMLAYGWNKKYVAPYLIDDPAEPAGSCEVQPASRAHFPGSLTRLTGWGTSSLRFKNIGRPFELAIRCGRPWRAVIIGTGTSEPIFWRHLSSAAARRQTQSGTFFRIITHFLPLPPASYAIRK
ncbi:MAG: hypothetical protein IID41_02450 [Planctomycetes bacterium]|nr:hypothetical protein [Planctomycetota bacterium]